VNPGMTVVFLVFTVTPDLIRGLMITGSVKCSFKKMPGESRHDSSGSLSKMPNHAGHNTGYCHPGLIPGVLSYNYQCSPFFSDATGAGQASPA